MYPILLKLLINKRVSSLLSPLKTPSPLIFLKVQRSTSRYARCWTLRCSATSCLALLVQTTCLFYLFIYKPATCFQFFVRRIIFYNFETIHLLIILKQRRLILCHNILFNNTDFKMHK